MLRIDRYLLREMLVPLLVGLGTFVVMITGHMLFTVVDKIVEHGVGMQSVLKFMLLQVPYATLLSLPAASLLASSLALNRLASENELTALRAGGAGFVRILRPLLVLGGAASLLALLLANSVVPWANHHAETMLAQMITKQPTLAFRPGKFTNTQTGLDFFAERVDQATNRLGNLFVFDRDAGGDTPLLFVAPQAHFSAESLITGPAIFYNLSSGGQLDWGSMESVAVNLGNLQFLPGMAAKSAPDMSLTELARQWRTEEAKGPGMGRRFAVEAHERVALALACLVFALLALPVTLSFSRGQSLVGVLATLVVVFVYYVIMLWLRMLAESGALPVALAAWAENGVLVVAAGVLLWRRH
ncbi:MAG TPA: LptF/LptG family permease [Armatimonadota bacterium]|jgi:LPS export ABC transporter permease LptF